MDATGMRGDAAGRIDLAEAAARDRVARYLAAGAGLDTHGGVLWFRAGRGRVWVLAVPNRDWWSQPGAVLHEHAYVLTVPGCEYPNRANRSLIEPPLWLDVHDPRRLPDGSYWVDAAVLALAASHRAQAQVRAE
jgi:hypothetical protein